MLASLTHTADALLHVNAQFETTADNSRKGMVTPRDRRFLLRLMRHKSDVTQPNALAESIVGPSSGGCARLEIQFKPKSN